MGFLPFVPRFGRVSPECASRGQKIEPRPSQRWISTASHPSPQTRSFLALDLKTAPLATTGQAEKPSGHPAGTAAERDQAMLPGAATPAGPLSLRNCAARVVGSCLRLCFKVRALKTQSLRAVSGGACSPPGCTRLAARRGAICADALPASPLPAARPSRRGGPSRPGEQCPRKLHHTHPSPSPIRSKVAAKKNNPPAARRAGGAGRGLLATASPARGDASWGRHGDRAHARKAHSPPDRVAAQRLLQAAEE